MQKKIKRKQANIINWKGLERGGREGEKRGGRERERGMVERREV